MTAQEQSCAFDQTSGVRKALDLVADKWTALIIMALAEDTKRYSELHRKIDGISQKMLTQTLRQLESNGLIRRKVYPVVPPMVEYSLTSLGKTLVEPLKALCRWASEHFHEVEVAIEQASIENTDPNEAA
ncbi:helix-turn-helix transcriptional regulator [Nostoc cf. edaphicum LEGE 07299]|uniref:Helix-turn-helix transcriptional regulator n=1 Tax=Nostoc cf. edaphicum LEGE 07299 TaxID=2777974 RepID=A0ABR9TUA4_9NOSO|nr:helix-turn-helix domain-containing protein [Nostoc edaphicum]MBE9103991.1 helix-turn-helix transcriptional regulator [Nostoc cf. edaphicum LEGE 07299]